MEREPDRHEQRVAQLWDELSQLQLSDDEIRNVCIPGAMKLAARTVAPPPSLNLTQTQANDTLRIIATYALIMTRDWKLSDAEKERRMKAAFDKVGLGDNPDRWKGFVMPARVVASTVSAMVSQAPRDRVVLLATGILTAHLKNLRDVGEIIAGRDGAARLAAERSSGATRLAENPDRYEFTDEQWPDWGSTCAVSASHTAGIWKIVGKPPGLPEPVSLVFDRDPERIRAELKQRGYTRYNGHLDVQHQTGIELWQKPKGANDAAETERAAEGAGSVRRDTAGGTGTHDQPQRPGEAAGAADAGGGEGRTEAP